MKSGLWSWDLGPGSAATTDRRNHSRFVKVEDAIRPLCSEPGLDERHRMNTKNGRGPWGHRLQNLLTAAMLASLMGTFVVVAVWCLA